MRIVFSFFSRISYNQGSAPGRDGNSGRFLKKQKLKIQKWPGSRDLKAHHGPILVYQNSSRSRPGSRKFLKTHPGPIPRARFHPVLLPIPDFISKTTLLDRLACRRDLYRYVILNVP